MGDDLLTLIQRFELLAFFAGFPFLFALAYYISGLRLGIHIFHWQSLQARLVASYAVTGSLFALYLLWQAVYTPQMLPARLLIKMLQIWGCTAPLFWSPWLQKRPFLSVLHSLPFFGIVAFDLILDTSSAGGTDVIRNDMKIFTDSVLLNLGTLCIVSLVFFVRDRVRQRTTH